MKTTTLNEIEKHYPCIEGWKKLLKTLNKTKSDNEQLSFKTILDSNGIKDAVWALCVLPFEDHALFRADVTESVLHFFEKEYPDDDRPRKAIQAIRDYHVGVINKEQLEESADAARDAVCVTAATAATAAYYAAYCAAIAIVASATSADTDDVYAATNYAADAADWEQIEQLFIKHFC